MSDRYDYERMAYRVVPDRNDPVILQVEAKLVRVINISAGGVSCASEHIHPGKHYPARVNLPDESADIPCELEALCKDKRNLLHCRFLGMDARHVDRLHHYVLERQKSAIKSVREKIT